VSGRRPIPRRRGRLFRDALRDPAPALAVPAGQRPRREHPASGAVPEGGAAAPGFRAVARQLRGPAASAGPAGPQGSAPEHRRWPGGTHQELPGRAGRSPGKWHRIPGPRSPCHRRCRPGHTLRARTGPRARRGPPDRSPPPNRMDLPRRKGRSGRTPGARTGRPILAGHRARRTVQAGPTGQRPDPPRRWLEMAADWRVCRASLPRRTSQAQTTSRTGRAGPGARAGPSRSA
jgi:hypothetical protein